MKILKLIVLMFILAVTPAAALICVSPSTVEDYLDMASLYQGVHKYYKALEYINMIEQYDEYNPKIKYQKVYLLKSLNDIKSAQFIMDRLILMNQDYVCSELALSIYDDEYKTICCSNSKKEHYDSPAVKLPR